MVDFNGKKMLVGCSAGRVNLLQEFENEELPQDEPVAEGRFAEYLTKCSAASFRKPRLGG